ncbi:amidohydrolase family protein [Caballeronia sp. LZ035]|uniref:amidohydrolase family protein n=1 Tax=Caballeronia sp. LZ035 TaxID=3038568 RepID=UPI0028561213|nr:amidohydrolase family protein [Caballeronia sp. LZ035]MDR5760596.1 amidohydrolase family protein [Caballeronia sp. LZ035]
MSGAKTLSSHGLPDGYAVPSRACDSHMHVFGPVSRFPGVEGHSYAPRPAPLEDWRRSIGALGLERAVIVQPSCYGTDNTCTLESVSSMGEHARAVVSIGHDITEAELLELHEAGARGVRLNAKSVGSRDAGAIAAEVKAVAERIAPLGWHLQLHAEAAVIVRLSEALHALECPVVIDHMGGMRVPQDDSHLVSLQALLRGGNCWVKLSAPYRIVEHGGLFDETCSLAAALIAANPARVVWGSDWPHTSEHAGRPQADPQQVDFRCIDSNELLALLAKQCCDESTFVRILVDNPAALYGFPV